MSRERNLLSPDQAQAVRAWLEATWPDIERRRLSRDAVAGLCAAAVGFRVTAGNLAGICRRLGRTWPSDSTSTQRLAFRVLTLKRALGHVYRIAGIEPPDADVARLLDLPWPAGDAADETDGTGLFDEVPY